MGWAALPMACACMQESVAVVVICAESGDDMHYIAEERQVTSWRRHPDGSCGSRTAAAAAGGVQKGQVVKCLQPLDTQAEHRR